MPANPGHRVDPPSTAVTSQRARPAAAVGSGILISRITGLLRDIAVAAFLGTQFAADAYWAAIKIPNIIRNLLGEGTLSASFVPVYSESLSGGDVDSVGAPRLARSVLGVVAVTALLLSALGVIFAPWITGVLLAASDEPTRDLTTRLVRILFPMSGVLIIGRSPRIRPAGRGPRMVSPRRRGPAGRDPGSKSPAAVEGPKSRNRVVP